MNRNQHPVAIGVAIALLGLGAGAALKPVAADGPQYAPIERSTVIGIVTTSGRLVPKAHWGIYALAEYAYTPGGKLSITKKNDLIVEEDMGLRTGGGRTAVKLKSGEYEIHVQPDNSRQIVKRFIVNNLSALPISLGFDVAPITDPDERQKTEIDRIGPSLGDFETRLQVLEKKNGITPPGAP